MKGTGRPFHVAILAILQEEDARKTIEQVLQKHEGNRRSMRTKRPFHVAILAILQEEDTAP